FSIRREQGRLAELEEAMRGAVAAYPSVPGWRCVMASLYAEIGKRDDAAREFAGAMAGDVSDIAEDSNWLAAVVLVSEACAFLGDEERAATLYEIVLPHAQLVAVAGIASACNGAIARALGLLAATLERWDDAVQHFEQALALNGRLGAPPFIVRTQVEYA